MKPNKYQELLKNQKPASLMRIAGEIAANSDTVQSLTNSHNKMMAGIKVLGFSLFGIFAIRQLTK